MKVAAIDIGAPAGKDVVTDVRHVAHEVAADVHEVAEDVHKAEESLEGDSPPKDERPPP